MNPISVISDQMSRQQNQYILFIPVAMAVGTASYFGLAAEPTTAQGGTGLCALAALIAAAIFRFYPRTCLLAAAVILGFLLAWQKAERATAPVLGWRYYGPVTGTIVKIDRSQSDKLRLTLSHVNLDRIDTRKTPKQVRISLHGKALVREYRVGEKVALTGHLQAPQGPVEPGGYDFRRRAWFQGLGALGYTRSPVILLSRTGAASTQHRINRVRARLSQYLTARLPNHGAFAAAILVGDRSGLNRPILDSLRRSNLAHLLAISGLHMALVTGTIFAGLRFLLALIPALALRFPIKKISASAAILAGAVYLMLSGANVPAIRAFVMVSVMYCAVLIDQRAISLRSVALAAMIILIFEPQELVEPGFQMSLAATTALVTAFIWLTRHRVFRGNRILSFLFGIVFSSFIAGAATAPFAAYHFNQFSNYGLLANVLSVPAMASIVMPTLLAAMVIDVIGLGGPLFFIADLGIEWILRVAGWVSSLPGVVTPVVKPATMTLLLVSAGFTATFIFVSYLRLFGPLVMMLGVVLWINTERPHILVAHGTGLVGVNQQGARALSKTRGDGFAARVWLENDGAPAPQQIAAERWSDVQLPAGVLYAPEKLPTNDCQGGILIAPKADMSPQNDCIIIDKNWLQVEGATALTQKDVGLIIHTVRQTSGDRLWTR